MGKWLLVAFWGLGTFWSGHFGATTPRAADVPPAEHGQAAEAEDIRVDLELDVLLVEFDVSVHTRRGDFIPGLTQDKFRLYEDGRPVPIVHFDEILQKSGAGLDGSEAAAGRHFLIFVDTYLASTRKIVQVRRELALFLEKHVVPGDSLSLAVLGPHGSLEVATGLDRDEAVARTGEISIPGGRFSAPAINSYEQARHVLAQVEESVSYVLASDVPVPRSLIVLAPGFVPAEPDEPMDIGEIADAISTLMPPGAGPGAGEASVVDPFRPGAERRRRFRGHVGPVRGASRARDQPSIEHLLNSLAGWLSARNVTLYAINCGEKGPLDLFSDNAFLAEHAGPAPLRVSTFGSGLSMAESMKLNMLRDLAELTGGLAWLNTRAYGRAFHHIDQATASVYRIGFRPDTDRPRHRYHKLKVVVDHKRVKVRHPRGWLDS